VFGDVGDPEPVGGIGEEPALHQVCMWGGQRSGPAVFAPMTDPGKAGGAHQPSDPLPPAGHAETQPQFGVHPRCAIRASGSGVNFGDGLRQRRVGGLAEAGRTAPPLVEARPRDTEHPAGHRDVDAVGGKLLDQPERNFGRTFSRAK
jgi:hypothetical protein